VAARAAYQGAKTATAGVALARLHLAAGETLEALSALEAARKQDPAHLGALNDLGVLYMKMDRVSDAVEVLEAALKVKDNSATRTNLAEALTRLDRKNEAIEHLKRAAVLAPESRSVKHRLAGLLLDTGKAKEAAPLLAALLPQEPDATSLVRVGKVFAQAGAHPQAVGYFGRALAVNPQALGALLPVGLSLEALGQTAKAAEAYQRYVAAAAADPAHAARVKKAQARLAALLATIGPE